MKSPIILFIVALIVGFEAGSRGWVIIAGLCFVLAALAGCLALALWYLGPLDCETTENAESTKKYTLESGTASLREPIDFADFEKFAPGVKFKREGKQQ